MPHLSFGSGPLAEEVADRDSPARRRADHPDPVGRRALAVHDAIQLHAAHADALRERRQRLVFLLQVGDEWVLFVAHSPVL